MLMPNCGKPGSPSKTIAAPYVTRAYDGAPVATPLDWEEVKRGLTPKTFNLTNAIDRFKEVGDAHLRDYLCIENEETIPL